MDKSTGDQRGQSKNGTDSKNEDPLGYGLLTAAKGKRYRQEETFEFYHITTPVVILAEAGIHYYQ